MSRTGVYTSSGSELHGHAEVAVQTFSIGRPEQVAQYWLHA